MKSLRRISLAAALLLTLVLPALLTGCAHRSATIKPDPNAPQFYQTDPAAFRSQQVNQKILEVFGTKLKAAKGDGPNDLMPKGTRPIQLINPGFEFTYDNGKAPGKDFWIIVIKADNPGYIQGGGKGKMSDPIQGWTAHICAGLESGRPIQWNTPPDGVTGYAIARGEDYYLHQTVPGALKPNTRYTLLIETFKRNDYKRATAGEIILEFADQDGKPLDAVEAEYHLSPADKTTGHGVCLVTLTTHADQKPGGLMVKIGMNANGGVRFNFDNARLWQQPVQ